MTEYDVLIPIDAPPHERAALFDDLADIFFQLQDQGVNPCADVQPEPDGDRWIICWDEPAVAA